MDWKKLLAYISGSVDEELLLRNEYLIEENRILRDQIKGRIRLTNAQRTWGNFVNVHPHFHSLSSCGIKDTDGVFYAVPEDCDFSPLEEMFRVALLDMLFEKQRITEKTRMSLLNWRHTGFSADASAGVQGGDREGLERITAYTLHPPLSLNRLNYVSGSSTVLYTGRFNPGTKKSNFTVLDCRDFLCKRGW